MEMEKYGEIDNSFFKVTKPFLKLESSSLLYHLPGESQLKMIKNKAL